MRGVVEIVDDTTIRHIIDNPVTAKFLGLTSKQMQNKLSSELGEPPEIIRMWVGHYRESQRTNKPVTFEYNDSRGADITWLSATVSFIGKTETGQERFAYIILDITTRRKAEEALRESEARFLKAFYASPAAQTIATLPEGRWVEVNDRFLRLTGYSRDEVIGHTSAELNMIDLNERSHILSRVKDIGSSKGYEIKITTKDGKEAWVYTSNEKIALSGKEHVLSIMLDISERKMVEGALRESEARFPVRSGQFA